MRTTSAWRRGLRVGGPLALVTVAACPEPGGRPDAAAPPPVAEAEALLLAAAQVALPPPADPATALPEPESDGAQLVARYCTGCHPLPTPRIHAATDWPQVTRRMWLRIDGLSTRFAVPRPTVAERGVILRYLTAHALRTSRAALPDGPGRHAYVTVCGRCHELPDLRTHTAADWGVVVARMQERMESMLGNGMSAEEQAGIVGYLAAAARAPDP